MEDQNSANDLNSGSTPSKFDSLDQPLPQALDGLNKEGRKAGRQEEDPQQALFLLSCLPHLNPKTEVQTTNVTNNHE